MIEESKKEFIDQAKRFRDIHNQCSEILNLVEAKRRAVNELKRALFVAIAMSALAAALWLFKDDKPSLLGVAGGGWLYAAGLFAYYLPRVRASGAYTLKDIKSKMDAQKKAKDELDGVFDRLFPDQENRSRFSQTEIIQEISWVLRQYGFRKDPQS